MSDLCQLEGLQSVKAQVCMHGHIVLLMSSEIDVSKVASKKSHSCFAR